jgi:hypothetical protein
MGRRSTWTSKDDDQLRALAASGETSAAIAARLKRTAAGIRRRATSLGIGLAGSRKAPALKGEGEMTVSLLPSIFTIEIGGRPTLTFEAQNLGEAHELCHEQWLKDDLAEAKSDGVPLWDGKAKLRARIALPEERVLA